ncbi:oocyte zinc finger protein XlCOF7.1-like [Mercenaria mercenaria]|uniref:oocyte zinc finger protein XlCOF7.1-like n=1 Tax=Mercenaria mercenaria TaxID=6596 RepID=UPI00234EAB7C|nr:oocyte zinc finger protein XlCOF7.1-like [Mercenaria mercenaria]XP_045164155.2 oocyte zinc finger protein XlCOF7.1-like [Mercenaria mercenaria]XP_045164156.2 oocyte zinc finger protein XlCOF7.1-like [Mercenaria mercenaria]XP_045164158.2 oocyte zinc finger protein XlCOF7.1-like [Mercenaria mercenaria]XP_045164161.2 oocyte zinc finger protein XlCOF7.1-like [Mercenaria mercenaria]XP_045164162.2 oocyte zinc finger protein XlCOF7.1-like [Mercenaria mercenaria]XP_053377658.1 oocyte zinc finger p
MMGDLDSCLDAFKHLPYFKPLYTTILRQQMQYLTEQLSQHAGEESLVLTTNISAGTISSLTSTYGTGFLDQRADIKKQFTVHCAKNKLKYDRSFSRRNTHIDNIYPQDQQSPALKRKRPDVQQNKHAVVCGYSQGNPVIIDGYSQAKDNHTVIDKNSRAKDNYINIDGYNQRKENDKITHAEKTDRKVCEVLTEKGVTSIEIENVRSLQHEEDSDKECNADGNKLPEKLLADPEYKSCNTDFIKQEPVENNCIIIAETAPESICNELTAPHNNQDSASILPELGCKDLQEVAMGGKNPERSEGGISIDIMNNMTDDVITIQKSYLSSSDECSLPEKISTETDDVIRVQKSYLSDSEEGCNKIATETDGNSMWIVAGVGSEANLVEMSESKRNELNMFNKQYSEQPAGAGINKSFESVMNKNFANATGGRFSSRANVASDGESGAQFMFNLSTPTQIRRPPNENKTKFECRYCTQCFTTPASQRRHERRHTGETPWSCEFCDKKFYRKDDLHVHSLKHSGQKPYMCPICLVGYCKKKLLDVHIASHGDWTAASTSSTSE